jgi:hypothetical protein
LASSRLPKLAILNVCLCLFGFEPERRGDDPQITLEQAHMRTHTSVPLVGRATEEGMWSYAVQLSSALRAAHAAGLVRGVNHTPHATSKPATCPGFIRL